MPRLHDRYCLVDALVGKLVKSSPSNGEVFESSSLSEGTNKTAMGAWRNGRRADFKSPFFGVRVRAPSFPPKSMVVSG